MVTNGTTEAEPTATVNINKRGTIAVQEPAMSADEVTSLLKKIGLRAILWKLLVIIFYFVVFKLINHYRLKYSQN
jgi:hypothetical protein